MPTITERTATAKDKSGTVYTLAVGDDVIEVWPFMGFNCLRWTHAGVPVLYTSPEWETNPVPTRSGHPILFPFPNRMKGGKFSFKGKEYQLPLNDSSGPNAIHGFTPRNVWRVGDRDAIDDYVCISAEFQLSKDLPEMLPHWPADARILVKYALTPGVLHVDVDIAAADGKPMPFGLGFHPYFAMPDAPLGEWKLQATAKTIWPATANLPSGVVEAVPAALDFNTSKPIGDTVFDTLYGGVQSDQDDVIATLSHGTRKLTVHADEAFRELLLFTPPHRQAIAIEPYTCTTDAANLGNAGVNSGWRTLAAGETFTSRVEYRYTVGE